MTLRLTPQNLIAAYDYLKTTAPFNKWKLPDSDDLHFQITDHADRYGHLHSFPKASGKYQAIAISAINTKTTQQLLETMAHELCHLKHFMDSGYKTRGYGHGPIFKALAKRVCAAHGFKYETF